jgi:transposase-like protein
MGQVLHGSAKTTHAVRAELQRSKAPVASLAKRYGINEKTVLKWRKRQSVEDMPMGPKERHSTVLSAMEEARSWRCACRPGCRWMMSTSP